MNVPGGQYKNIIFHNAAVATANGAVLDVTEASGGAFSVVGIQITGISGDTITFEVNIDGTNWISILAENVTTGAEATTATANGIYRITCLGMVQLRARLTRSAGTVTATGVCVS
jgi:hypothetical protein